MQRFQAQSASQLHQSPSVSDASEFSPKDTTGAIAPELQHLSSSDIAILDAVIHRAGHSATTFFTVFKAYSDVLKERGLDPQEVVYYGKLLKLGTMKGKNWGEKWDLVKAQLGKGAVISAVDHSDVESEVAPFESVSRIFEQPYVRPAAKQAHAPLRQPYTSRDLDKTFSLVAQSTPFEKADFVKQTSTKPDDFISSTPVQRVKARTRVAPTIGSEDGEISSPVPPSYKSTAHEHTLPVAPLLQKPENRSHNPRPELMLKHRKIVAPPKEKKKAADMDDAWKNIKMEEDEKCADDFRETILIAKCFEIWKQGYFWIKTTHQQIQEARDSLLLRVFMQRWGTRLASQRHLEGQLIARFMRRHLKRIFRTWQVKLGRKRQIAWRIEMRQKMKVVKNKSEFRVKKDVWMKWQQQLLARRAHEHYELGLLSRSLSRWKQTLVRIDDLDNIAEEFSRKTALEAVVRCWHYWKGSTILKHQGAIVSQRVDCRIMAEAFDVWRNRMAYIEVAETFRHKITQKRALSVWKMSINGLKALDNRAEKYVARQDESLLRAVFRIWRARMRGKRLEQFKTLRLMKYAWQKWRYRVGKEEAQLEVSKTFLNRINSRVVASAFMRWREVQTTHRNALAYAVKYDETHLQARALLLWRIRLADNIQSAKVARWAHRYFATRKAWQLWIQAAEEKRRQRRLQEFNRSKLRTLFNVWRHRTTKERQMKQCEEIVQELINHRVIRAMLTRWTNRVIEIKSRELDVATQCDLALQRAAWVKWRICRQQHVEEVSLLENYLLVKKEDLLRRTFYRWMASKRLAEHRRVTHQRKEAHLRQVAIVTAWDKWRERFKEERLLPLEYEVILANRRNLMLRAFSAWVGKSDSLPAVRFHSKHLKAKFFKLWRNVMPNAMRVKKARETDRTNTLARYFSKWVQTYKTKTTLKAVARAKCLRLPTTATRQPALRPAYSAPTSGLFPRRRPPTPVDESHADETASVVSSRTPFVSRRRVECAIPARSEKSPTRSEYAPSVTRQSSPVRSIVSMPDRRSKTPTSFNPPASIASSAVEGESLWTAIRKAGQTRRPRNL
ncbi:unnamed protein product [Cyclocybe aegerita]|uniref:Sfi1 spindle body domain-containing protein n=1 Tax=Cyclocybe aegerita TaxID=1973307 RepID=A0A8S0WUQ8_CYCAE|nr:unnamed protein product [Cyclocybe aegerita]